MAAETFYHNFIERLGAEDDDRFCDHTALPIEKQAKVGLVVRPLADLLAEEELIAKLRAEQIDLVAGGPPCQGFSLAGRRDPKDERNRLAWQFLEFVEKISPKAVLIENVAGMQQNFRKHGSEAAFGLIKEALEQIGQGYCVQPMLLNAMHFGAAQHRPRVMLLGLRKDVAAAAGVSASPSLWRSDFLDTECTQVCGTSLALSPTNTRASVTTVSDAIADLTEMSKGRRSNYAERLATDRDWLPEHIKRMIPEQVPLTNHKRRAHTERVVMRFRLYQALLRQGVDAEVLTCQYQSKIEAREDRGLLRLMEKSISFPLMSADGTVLARNPSEAVNLLKALATKKHSQRALSWDKPSPTVLSVPDDFVHPKEPRAMTVRELARFQSFPDAFEFRGKETTGGLKRRTEVPQYTQVGNAVPPVLAHAVGTRIAELLWSEPLKASLAKSQAA